MYWLACTSSAVFFPYGTECFSPSQLKTAISADHSFGFHSSSRFSFTFLTLLFLSSIVKSLLRKDFMILTSYIVLPLLTEIIQMSHYGIALLNTGVSLSLLIIFINIQSERELRMERQEKELTEARIDIMLSQIKPHFLYNTLTVIRRQCDIDPKQAKNP